MAIEIGRLCIKLAGRDAGKKCVILQLIDKSYVLIDGETRRRKCNIAHLEPLDEKIEISESAEHSEVVKAFKKLGIDLIEKKSKEKKERPKKQRKVKKKPEVSAKKKKEAKKAEKKAQKKEAQEEKAEKPEEPKKE